MLGFEPRSFLPIEVSPFQEMNWANTNPSRHQYLHSVSYKEDATIALHRRDGLLDLKVLCLIVDAKSTHVRYHGLHLCRARGRGFRVLTKDPDPLLHS